MKISTWKGRRKTQGFLGMRDDYVQKEKNGEDEVENSRELSEISGYFFLFHNSVKKTQRSCPVLRGESCPLMLGQPSIMLMRVFSDPVCPPWGLIL